MTRPLPRVVLAVQRKLRTTLGKRFRRFFLAAVAAVLASQLTLATCLGRFHLTAGRSALAAWVAGAATSYVVSRWAWERKGRPNVLRETIPFWLVAAVVAVILTSTTKFANQRAIAMGLTHSQQVLFDGAAFFVANTVTFLCRFVLFHYVLFVDRKPKAVAAVSADHAVRANGTAVTRANGLGAAEPGETGLRAPGNVRHADETLAPLAQPRG